ncbi:hypothetical protein ABIC03_005091 [Bradyrhizobium sp. RT6a]|uniref:hypothetical protein n=1 Tax=Bradyrhizobium sp. RT6a TaxID=3156381 RepID=UPI00339A7E67
MAKALRQNTRCDGFVLPRGEHNVTDQPDHHQLDLIKMRQQITGLRSRHSDNLRVTYLLNSLLIKFAYLTEPTSAVHAEYLCEAFERTMAEVEKSIARK